MNLSHWSTNEIPEASSATTELEEHEREVIQYEEEPEVISTNKSKLISARTHQRFSANPWRTYDFYSTLPPICILLKKKKKVLNQTKEESHHNMTSNPSMYSTRDETNFLGS